MSRAGGAGWAVWRLLLKSQLREQPGRLFIAVLAIAVGVALGTAVYLVNTAALAEFEQATRRLTGDADLMVQGPPQGFDEALFVRLVRDPQLAAASPVLELEAALPGQHVPLHVLGIDAFRAAGVQPALIGAMAAQVRSLLEPDTILLSSAASTALRLGRGDTLTVMAGSDARRLRAVDVMPVAAYTQSLGIMDIAAAQWTFARLGRLTRVDLRLRPGQDVQAFRARLAPQLPPGLQIMAPQMAWDRARTVTRAYRVNLNMLALVTLLTGAFLVFATQSLSALRRRTELALLRALGLTGPELERVLVGEGALLGGAGALIGICLGVGIAGIVLNLLNGDIGNGQMHVTHWALPLTPWPLLIFFLLGVGTACLGSWVPAREAARRAPALALKPGDVEQTFRQLSTTRLGLGLMAAGALLAWLPPMAGLPVAGYAAIAALLFGAVLLLPAAVTAVLALLPHTNRILPDIAIAQLRGSVGLSTASLATIVVSFSLMIAMAIMVHSFRDTFDRWLTRMLPADLQLRVPLDSDTASWSAAEQARIAGLPGVRRAEFRRSVPLYLRPDRAAVTLIARDGTVDALNAALPLVHGAPGPAPAGRAPLWISEAVADKFGFTAGSGVDLPLSGRALPCYVAGIWRDYARPNGALVMPRDLYRRLTGDSGATEGAVWLDPGGDPVRATTAIRALFANGDWLEINATPAVRERSLALFDRAFAITYGLEAVAVAIGLLGVSVAASATVFARRVQFGMLRHVGMLRRQVLGMLAAEGLLLSAIAAAFGLVLGTCLSLVLVYVVNRQSFNWSIDLSIPAGQLLRLSGALVVAACVAAVWSGRAATGAEVIRAVREDW